MACQKKIASKSSLLVTWFMKTSAPIMVSCTTWKILRLLKSFVACHTKRACRMKRSQSLLLEYQSLLLVCQSCHMTLIHVLHCSMISSHEFHDTSLCILTTECFWRWLNLFYPNSDFDFWLARPIRLSFVFLPLCHSSENVTKSPLSRIYFVMYSKWIDVFLHSCWATQVSVRCDQARPERSDI